MTKWTDITPREVEQIMLQTNIQLIDVRSVDEYREGHIKGSKLIPLDQLDVRTHELDVTKEVICICRSGGRSTKACEYLASKGLSNVKNMIGGITAWRGDLEQ